MECRVAAMSVITLVMLLTSTIFTDVDAGVVCTITELAPCTGDFASPQAPSSACCVKVKSQQTCFCQYAEDPVSTVHLAIFVKIVTDKFTSEEMAIKSRGMMNGILIAVIAVAVIVDQADVAMAMECNIAVLNPCLPVIQNPQLMPTAECCADAVTQQPCFCVYLGDPRYRALMNSPGAKKVLAVCGLQPPVCS
ncbi:hypothetical protein AgCh_011769 [Apium graveolens]